MSKIKIIVIGENCTDKFIYGSVNRLCPEAPVPILNPYKSTKNPGMAGNVVENIKALKKNCDIKFIHQKDKITKTRFVDEQSNQMIIRVDEGEGDIKPLELTQELIDDLLLADIVIVSDYNKGFLSNEILNSISDYSSCSILDSKRIMLPIFKNFTFIKLNKNERLQQKDSLIDDLNIITTLGKEGAEYNGCVYPSPMPRDTIDVSGAGDTFVASFITKIYETDDISDSIKFANEMASIVVSKRGVATPF
jgi:D-beta-D-heptose 7-phosphate kinase/D-beta-D-heptose 1-phosphate adenosyltransferase